MLSVAGKGGSGGGGGLARLGQPHWAMLGGGFPGCGTSDVANVSTASGRDSPMVGNLSEMMPRLLQASLLRKKVSEHSVMYVIWLVESMWPCASEPDRLSRMAPSSLMPSLLAECIFVFTGMRLDVVNPSLWMRLIPAKQLWHPVSARTVMEMVFVACDVDEGLSAVSTKFALMTFADRVMVGWG